LALATEAPTVEILERPPENKQAPLITVKMWKMVVGQSMLQIALNLGLLYGGPALFDFKELKAVGGVLHVEKDTPAFKESEVLKTIVFNTFVFLQLFNMLKYVFIWMNTNYISAAGD
jgi:Ca2+-transporting ATPase